MKIIKESKVETITEEIHIEQGTYYFSTDNSCQYYKIVFEEDSDKFIDYTVIEVNDYADEKSIILRSDGIYECLPHKYQKLFLGGGKKIEKEEFEENRQEVKERL